MQLNIGAFVKRVFAAVSPKKRRDKREMGMLVEAGLVSAQEKTGAEKAAWCTRKTGAGKAVKYMKSGRAKTCTGWKKREKIRKRRDKQRLFLEDTNEKKITCDDVDVNRSVHIRKWRARGICDM